MVMSVGCEKCIRFGSAVDGVDAHVGAWPRAALRASSLLNTGRPKIGLSGLSLEAALWGRGRESVLGPMRRAARQPSPRQAAARLYSRSRPTSLVITIT